jgi:DNA polymerase-3 subunit gamma/tau
MVRYLRNTLMAKIGGEQTNLLQISTDERARAARTAMLFSEEEITRNLQIVLRTFDDLNYRQEQRFHLELGLLKLIHAQRLLPIEELLSGASSAPRIATPAAHSTPRPSPAASRTQAAPTPPAAPPLSPFAPNSWSSGPSLKQSTSPVAQMERPAPTPEAARTPEPSASQHREPASPFPAASTPAIGFAEAVTRTEGALAVAPETSTPRPPTSAPTVDSLRHAVGSALVNAGHSTAATLLGSGAWILEPTSLRIEVPGVGKKMLTLTVNAAAEKIIRQELQRLGAPARFMVVPGEGDAQAATPMAAPLAGSVQEAALAHPLVQRAKEIFKAEVRSVVDLRQK